MRHLIKARDVPERIATGAYILHSGLEKWHADDEHAAAIHSTAAGAFPLLKDIDPPKFLRFLAASEVTTGALLLSPTRVKRSCRTRAHRILRGSRCDVRAHPRAAKSRQHLAKSRRNRHKQGRLDARHRYRARRRRPHAPPQEAISMIAS